ncbi:MAG: GNAT family N-acetyltransferase [Gammaproteobacteria bacterium]
MATDQFEVKSRQIQGATWFQQPQQGRLSVGLACSESELRESQRLRYKVFAEEQGADLHGTEPGLDEDKFDAYCRHVLVRDNESDEVIASTRVLLDLDARRAGGFYSEGEFELDSVLTAPGRTMEIGRTCVHPDYRRGAVISMLWSGLARLINVNEFQRIIGCASIPMHDGGAGALATYAWLSRERLVSTEFNVHPRLPLPPISVAPAPLMPPLLKAYVRLGAMICGEPCWDPEFNTADMLVVLDTANLQRRYVRRYLQK